MCSIYAAHTLMHTHMELYYYVRDRLMRVNVHTKASQRKYKISQWIQELNGSNEYGTRSAYTAVMDYNKSKKKCAQKIYYIFTFKMLRRKDTSLNSKAFPLKPEEEADALVWVCKLAYANMSRY